MKIKRVTQILKALKKPPLARSYDDLLLLKAYISKTEFITKDLAGVVNPRQMNDICRSLGLEIFRADEIIFNQGDNGDKVYIILTGRCEVRIRYRIDLTQGQSEIREKAVGKNSSQEDIKKAYRKLALKWHPDRCPPEKKDEAQTKFQEIGEAFEVLSDPEKKRIYDQVGEEGLKGGFPGGDGEGPQGPGGARFHFSSMPGGGGGMHFSNAEEIFRQFLGTANPFDAENSDDFGHPFASFMGGGPNIRMTSMGGGFPGGMGGMGGFPSGGGSGRHVPPQPQRKADPVQHDLKVSLEDLYTGTTKRVRITKKIADATGAIVPVTAEKEIIVKPGWKSGTKITFEREGDELPGVIPADITFVIQAKPHDRFERDGDNLIYTCPVTLYEALCGVRTTVQHLDGRQIPIEAKNVTPDTVKIIPAEGMPNSKTKSKGDLRVKFRIIFPDLTESERNQIGSIIKHHHDRHRR